MWQWVDVFILVRLKYVFDAYTLKFGCGNALVCKEDSFGFGSLSIFLALPQDRANNIRGSVSVV